MSILSKPSSAAQTSLMFITVGVLVDVWSGIWFYYMNSHKPAADWPWYFCLGLLLSGSAVAIIGLAIGQIGRAARHAELPPKEVVNAEVQAEQTAAARAPIVAPVNPANPLGATVAGQVPVAPFAPGVPSAAPVTGAVPQP